MFLQYALQKITKFDTFLHPTIQNTCQLQYKIPKLPFQVEEEARRKAEAEEERRDEEEVSSKAKQGEVQVKFCRLDIPLYIIWVLDVRILISWFKELEFRNLLCVKY